MLTSHIFRKTLVIAIAAVNVNLFGPAAVASVLCSMVLSAFVVVYRTKPWFIGLALYNMYSASALGTRGTPTDHRSQSDVD